MPFFMMLYSPQPRRGGRARRTPHTFSEKLVKSPEVCHFVDFSFLAQHQLNFHKTALDVNLLRETYPRQCDQEGDKRPTAQ